MIKQIQKLEDKIKKYSGFSQDYLSKIYSTDPLTYWFSLVDYSSKLHWSSPKHVNLYTELYTNERTEEDDMLNHLMVENV